jgi:trehalose 6-phosphate phosphatase
MAWEIKPAAVDKGVAVAALMSRAPFAGRAPVFVGDDVTDEDGIRVALAMGGAGLRVPDLFGSAAGVRDWLARAAAEGVWPAL